MKIVSEDDWWSLWIPITHTIGREILGVNVFELGATGLQELDDGVEAYFSPKTDIPHVKITLQQSLDALGREFGFSVGPVQIRAIPFQDWNREWRKGLHAIDLGGGLVIKPSWEPTPDPVPEFCIEIDPEMAFGTGYHPTTRLCLGLIRDRLKKGDRVLDVGTGTGILAIAAIKWGAVSVDGVDIDPIAARTALVNASKNGVADRMRTFAGPMDALSDISYDLVIANIQRSILIPILDDCYKRLLPHAHLILSGLLTTEADTMKHHLEKRSMTVKELRTEGEWIAIDALSC